MKFGDIYQLFKQSVEYELLWVLNSVFDNQIIIFESGGWVALLLYFLVNNVSMLRFICDKTAALYFWNLVWFIAEHVREVDKCVWTNKE